MALRNILIIQTASLGDVILSTPLIEKLHYYYPESQIDFLLKKGYESIFQQHPYINRIITWDKSHRKFRHLKYLAKLVRNRRYDAVINVQRFASSGLITAYSGAKHRIGFSKNPFSIFFTKRVRHKIGKGIDNPHEVERNLALISSLADSIDGSNLSADSTSGKIPGLKPFPVKLYPTNHNFAKVSQYKTRKYIIIAPASLWFTKQYPEDKWVAFVKEAASSEPDLTIYFLGATDERALCDRIIQAANIQHQSINLAGKFSFLESAALMRDAAMNFVNDSAPMHLASAINAPVTVIYCSTVPEFGFGPLSDKSYIVQSHGKPDCKPCGLHGFKKCPKKHFDCAYLIKEQQLLERL